MLGGDADRKLQHPTKANMLPGRGGEGKSFSCKLQGQMESSPAELGVGWPIDLVVRRLVARRKLFTA